MRPRHQRWLALYAPSLVLFFWAVIWILGLRTQQSDVVTLLTIAAAAAAHTYEEIKTRRRRRR
jgi:hypothetical protein